MIFIIPLWDYVLNRGTFFFLIIWICYFVYDTENHLAATEMQQNCTERDKSVILEWAARMRGWKEENVLHVIGMK